MRSFKSQSFFQVRVGDQNVDDTPESEMICKNQLCYMIGNNNVVSNAAEIRELFLAERIALGLRLFFPCRMICLLIAQVLSVVEWSPCKSTNISPQSMSMVSWRAFWSSLKSSWWPIVARWALPMENACLESNTQSTIVQ